ncbi:hypothetical protein [Nonomuraea sp. NPDC052265]|uniref:hypothetical protein n=1 Tax=Nonomuraea sp. NPDC052265 TaxID=3364374 RepID=UPI0037CA3301
MRNARSEMATTGQLALIQRIADELANPPQNIEVMVSMLTRETAGKLIEVMKGWPRKWDRTPLAEGFYHRRGRVYRVARSELGRPYAVRLLPDGLEIYSPGIIRQLRPDEAL